MFVKVVSRHFGKPGNVGVRVCLQYIPRSLSAMLLLWIPPLYCSLVDARDPLRRTTTTIIHNFPSLQAEHFQNVMAFSAARATLISFFPVVGIKQRLHLNFNYRFQFCICILIMQCVQCTLMMYRAYMHIAHVPKKILSVIIFKKNNFTK